MKAVVTGGAGFVGSHLAEGLLDKGYQVTVLDDLSTGKLANISHLIDEGRIDFIEGSILDQKLLLQLFNVYGRRQDLESRYSTVIPAFIDTISRGQAPEIYGDGEQTRDFTFVSDVVEANILAAESEAAGVYNIGRGNSVSINRLASTIAGLLESDVKPVYQDARPGRRA